MSLLQEIEKHGLADCEFNRKLFNIETMTNDDFIDYRENLLNVYLNKGYKLKPNIHCPMCDSGDNYTCFQCEIYQLESKGI